MPKLPHSVDSEKYILGGILLDNDLILQTLDILDAEDFYVTAHKPLYKAMEHLAEHSIEINHITIQDALKDLGLYSSASLKDLSTLIADLTKNVPASSDLSYYVASLKDTARERKKLALSSELQTSIFAGDKTKTEEVEEALANLAFPDTVDGLTHVSDGVGGVLEKAYKTSISGNPITGLATGIQEFDEITAGLQPDEVVIIAARPAVGKTAFGVTVAQYASIINGKTVLIFSMEMSKASLVMRLLASLAKVSLHKIKTGTLTYAEWARLIHAQELLKNSNLYIDDTASQTPRKLKTAIKKFLIKHKKIDLVMLDYLQLMTMGFNKTENRQQEVSQMSRYIKILAKEFSIPILTLSQLSRAPEQRNSTKHKPLISDLRESGSIEQDADMVALLYREELYEATDDNEGLTQLIIGKHRNGETKSIPMFYVKDQTRFENIFIS